MDRQQSRMLIQQFSFKNIAVWRQFTIENGERSGGGGRGGGSRPTSAVLCPWARYIYSLKSTGNTQEVVALLT